MFEAIFGNTTVDENEMESLYKLSYFNYRGTAEPIRMIFKVAKVPFEDHRLEWNSAWDDEHKQRFPWGSLPVLTVGEDMISHSTPIARYLARKYNLVGTGDIEEARCDEMVDTMTDLQEEAIKVFVETDDFKKAKALDSFLDVTAPSYLSRFEKMYQANPGPWLVGQELTWADIYVAYGFDYLESLLGEKILLTQAPGLEELKGNVYAVPEIKEWIETRPNGTGTY